MFFRLLLESFVRQRRRKLLAGVAILLGATAVTAMLAIATTIGDRIHSELSVFGANIVVTPKAANVDVKIGGADIQPAMGNAYLHESDLAKLQTIFWANNITGVSPELAIELNSEQNGKASAIDGLGLWFNHSSGSLKTGAPQLHPWWKLTGTWPASSEQAVLGNALARSLNLHAGDALNLPAPAAPMESAARAIPLSVPLTITGIVSTGDATDNKLLLPLETAQSLNNTPDAVSRVEISAITKPEDAFARQSPDTLSPQQREIWYCRAYANSIARDIQQAIPGSDAQQVRRVEQSEGVILDRISGLMWLISAAALLAAGFAVSAAMATAILERRAEIGLMRSMGAAKSSIALLFYAEAGLLAILAGSIGYFLGSGLAAWLGARIFAGAATTPPATTHLAALLAVFNPVLLPAVVGLALAVAIGGSTPSIRAALRLDPSTVLRSDA